MDPIPKLGEVLPSKVHIKLTSTPRALCDRESNDNIRFLKKKSIVMIMITHFFLIDGVCIQSQVYIYCIYVQFIFPRIICL